MDSRHLESSYDLAAERYAAHQVDVEAAIETLATVAVSLHCWQGDDVQGFETTASGPSGGIAVTGNYPGRARTPDELRADLDRALSLIPGTHRLNLHACYGEFGGDAVDRDAIEPGHFTGWIDWAADRGMGLDFNPTFFAHPKAADGMTLAHPDAAIRDFWIEHGRRSREIAAEMGRRLGSPCVNNIWVPDGMKDTPADRFKPRQRLATSLDRMLEPQHPAGDLLDAVECKLFGIGSESYVVGSHEFYMGYALTRNKLLCLDAGHFHPTESIADKLSSVLLYFPEILLHVSRGVRWDSDHVIVLNDDLLAITREIVANDHLGRVHIGLDFFDASINRVAAWVIGVRNLLKGLLAALLEPPAIREAERAGDFTTRLALQEEARMLPLGAVWDHYCETRGVPAGSDWLPEVRRYESEVQANR